MYVQSSPVPDLGPRGEGWVAIQLALFAAIVGCGFADVYWPHSLESFLAVLGLVLMAVGLVVLVYGTVSLGRSFTPLPRPHPGAELREHGAFRVVRHPIYGGIVLLALGWSAAVAPLALLPTALLAFLFDLKARREEAWLLERYPEYGAYLERTPHRFVPGLY
jgi:protein-S-isoprenylcysteine O-methyltransferase Ste14